MVEDNTMNISIEELESYILDADQILELTGINVESYMGSIICDMAAGKFGKKAQHKANLNNFAEKIIAANGQLEWIYVNHSEKTADHENKIFEA